MRAVGFTYPTPGITLGPRWVRLDTGEEVGPLEVTKGDLTTTETAAQLREFFCYQGDRHAVDGVRTACEFLPTGVFPGMITLGYSPVGTVYQARRSVYVVTEGGPRRVLGEDGNTAMGVVLEGPEVDPTVHEDEEARWQRLQGQILTHGRAAKSQHRWCGVYERLITTLGLTAETEGRVTFSEARRYPPGSVFRFIYADTGEPLSGENNWALTRRHGASSFRVLFGSPRSDLSNHTNTMEVCWTGEGEMRFPALEHEIRNAPIGAALSFGDEDFSWVKTDDAVWRVDRSNTRDTTERMLHHHRRLTGHWTAL